MNAQRYIGKSAWESNPPAKLVTPLTRFEDEDSHRTTCALTEHCTILCGSYAMHL